MQKDYNKSLNLKSGIGNAGQIADIVGALIPKKEQSALTTGLNQGYDAASNIMMTVNPIIGGAMKVGGLLSDGINAITGGTDGMTT